MFSGSLCRPLVFFARFSGLTLSLEKFPTTHLKALHLAQDTCPQGQPTAEVGRNEPPHPDGLMVELGGVGEHRGISQSCHSTQSETAV